MARYFEYKDAKSDKFWEIDLQKSSYTVRFGRRGTEGQVQTKDLGTEDAAKKAYEKLIAEKLAKGYTETVEQSAGSAPVLSPAVRAAKKIAKDLKKIFEEETKVEVTDDSIPVSPEKASTETGAQRSIDLDDEGWRWATWRNIAPEKEETPDSFDFEKCIAQLKKVKVNYWLMDWSAIDVPRFMTRQEAHFWFSAFTPSDQPNYSHVSEKARAVEDLKKRLRSEDFTGVLSTEDFVAACKRESSAYPQQAFLALYYLLPPEKILELALKAPRSQYLQSDPCTEGFRKYIAPRLDSETKRRLHEILRPYIQPKLWPIDPYHIPVAFHLASYLGMHDDLRVIVESWEDDLYTEDHSDFYHRPQDVIFGLANASLIEHHMRRMKLRLIDAVQIRAWIAHTEYRALDLVKDSIQSTQNKDQAEKLIRELYKVRSPETAAVMIELYVESRSSRQAREWLDKNPSYSIPGIIPFINERGRIAEIAIDLLRSFQSQGFGEVILAESNVRSNDLQDKLRKSVVDYRSNLAPVLENRDAPDWLIENLSEKAKLPNWVKLESLPPVLIGNKRFSDELTRQLLYKLQTGSNPEALRFYKRLQEHADLSSLESFAWKLFDIWLAEGAPSREKWALMSLGYLGGDGTALKLAPLVRAWPGQAQHQRAVSGLEVLRHIGTDAALMQLNGIAQKVPFKALKAKAAQYMEEIAKQKGLTRAELEDRIVPDCGLDEKGRRVFDFGPRKYMFALGPEMKPMVRDEDGKFRDDLPKPSSKDDSGLAAKAVEDWKLLKKQIREVAKIQAFRLEQAMVVGRRWTVSDFERLIVRHPLMTLLARLVLWAGFDKNGKLQSSFRVTDEQDYADVNDQPTDIKVFERIGIAHPLQLSDEQKNSWGEIFSDYELIPPFAQLGRPAYRLEKAEQQKTEIDRYKGIQLPAPTLVFTLEKFGWLRGLAMDAGCFDEHSKPFPAADLTAVVIYEGTVGMGYIDPNEYLTLDRCYFVRGNRPPSGYEQEAGIPLNEVDPIVISEVLNDLQQIAGKGK